jgi:hypothetical protein
MRMSGLNSAKLSQQNILFKYERQIAYMVIFASLKNQTNV